MLVLAFLAGLCVLRARAPGLGIDRKHVNRLFVLVLAAAVVGSRVLYVVEHPSLYAADGAHALRLWEGGLSMYGGAVLAAAVALAYSRAASLPFASVADLCAPALALGEALKSIGCFLNGCCFGMPSSRPWAVVFPLDSAAGHVFPGAAIHPTQLYNAAASLLIFVLLLAAERKRRPPGYTVGLFLLLHAVAWFALDSLRHHEASAVIFPIGYVVLTFSLLVSMELFLAGACILLLSKARSA